MSNFSQFGLHDTLNKVLNDLGFTQPTPIQEQVIPKALAGADIIASANTGTGKTAAFLLPALQFLSDPSYKADGGPQVLVLVPTRELAIQVADQAEKFSKYMPRTKTVCIYGGVPYPVQRRALSRMHEILVATPGRLIDYVNQGKIDLSKIKLLILDEADRMLDMGFVEDVEFVAEKTPKSRQTLLFSATIDKKILPISQKIQKNPQRIAVETSRTIEKIEQRLYYADNADHKMRLLENLLQNTEIQQGIIFTSTKSHSEELASYLDEMGLPAGALHGDMNQRQRTRTINKLREGRIQLLVATDVAARGIDVSTITHVINFDLPFQAEDFVHRVGRTGRAGATGMAISFAVYRDAHKLSKIVDLLGKPFDIHSIQGMEPKPASGRKDMRPRGNGRQSDQRRPGRRPPHGKSFAGKREGSGQAKKHRF